MTENEDQDRLCVNCQHCYVNWNYWYEFLTRNPYYLYRCTVDTEDEIDLVTGKIVSDRKQAPTCRFMRINSECDLEGKLWEPSKKFAAKKSNLFKVLKFIK